MPHLRFRGLKESAVKKLSAELPRELAKVLSTPADNFTVEKVATTFFREGKILSDDECDPMVEFIWFDRGAETRDVAAKKVTELVAAHTESKYIAVVFFDIPRANYFENGEHF